MTVQVLESPIKSECDKKTYKVIRLSNGLTATLISDPTKLDAKTEEIVSEDEDVTCSESDSGSESDEDKTPVKLNAKERKKKKEKLAAVSLTIKVGSFSDPKDILGLAHFLEHMVFMGSAKFPDENDFDSFLNKVGGNNNASTDYAHTNFYFEVHEKHLNATLERFAEFFIAPLLKRDSMTRERNAVESEYQQSITNDDVRLEMIMVNMAEANHPVRGFCFGNLKTLKENVNDEHLYASLVQFHREHYSANRMTVAIQACLPMETIEKCAIDHLEPIPNNQKPSPDFHTYPHTDIFDPAKFRRMYFVRPQKHKCELYVNWVLPSYLSEYKTNPIDFWSFVIGHEGRGSLLSHLKRKFYATAIDVCPDDGDFAFNSMFTLFTIQISLTERGLKNLQEVLNAIFSYLKLLKTLGPERRLFDEMLQNATNEFRFQSDCDAVDVVTGLSIAMQRYEPREYLRADVVSCQVYDEMLLRSVLRHFRPDAMNVTVLAVTPYRDDLIYDEIEPWFQTNYTHQEIPASWLEHWRDIDVFPDFAMPEPNCFIANDFQLLTHVHVPTVPEKIWVDERVNVWYKPDVKFQRPVARCNFSIVLPRADVIVPKRLALRALYHGVLNHLVAEELYAALDANYSYSVELHARGLELCFAGYNQHLPKVIDAFVAQLKNFNNEINRELFEQQHEKLRKAYHMCLTSPRYLAMDMFGAIGKTNGDLSISCYNALVDVTYEDFLAFTSTIFQRVFVTCLIQGNVARDQAIEIARKFVRALDYEPLPREEFFRCEMLKFPDHSTYCVMRSLNENDPNTCVYNTYQGGLGSLKILALSDLLTNILEEPCYNMLRTKEQLGYEVFCGTAEFSGVCFFLVYVNSQADKFSAQHVESRIEAFVDVARDKLVSLTDDDFNQHRGSLIKLKSIVDTDLQDEVGRNWEEIFEEDFVFDRRERYVEILRDCTLADVIELFDWYCPRGNPMKKLSIQVLGYGVKEGDETASDKAVNNAVIDRETFETFSLTLLAPPELLAKPNVKVMDDVRKVPATWDKFPEHHITE